MSLFARLFGNAESASRVAASTPTTQIPVVQTIRTSAFCFGIPWPWQLAPEEAVASTDAPPIVAVTALRTDGKDPLFYVSEPGSDTPVGSRGLQSRLNEFAQREAARPTGIRQIALGGSPAHVLQASRGTQRLALLIAPSQERLLQGCLRVPTPGYLHHFEVMLATWRWTR